MPGWWRYLSTDEVWQRILGRTAELSHEACTQLTQTSQQMHLCDGPANVPRSSATSG